MTSLPFVARKTEEDPSDRRAHDTLGHICSRRHIATSRMLTRLSEHRIDEIRTSYFHHPLSLHRESGRSIEEVLSTESLDFTEVNKGSFLFEDCSSNKKEGVVDDHHDGGGGAHTTSATC